MFEVLVLSFDVLVFNQKVVSLFVNKGWQGIYLVKL